jgi:hypothetical protein
MLDGRRVCPNLKAADTNTFADAGFTVLEAGKKIIEVKMCGTYNYMTKIDLKA